MPRVGFALGVAACNAAKYDDSVEETMREHVADRYVCAIGSCGLAGDDQVQIAVFERQIALANEFGLPLIVAAQGAYTRALEVLQAVGVPQAGVLVHGFAGTKDELAAWVDAGCHVSFDVRAADAPDEFRELARIVPKQRILVESGAPELSAGALAGYPPRADQVVFAAQALLDICPAEQLAKNTIAFFGL